MLETFCQGLSTSSTNAVPQETVHEQVSVDLLIHGQLTAIVYMQDFFLGGGGVFVIVISRARGMYGIYCTEARGREAARGLSAINAIHPECT